MRSLLSLMVAGMVLVLAAPALGQEVPGLTSWDRAACETNRFVAKWIDDYGECGACFCRNDLGFDQRMYDGQGQCADKRLLRSHPQLRSAPAPKVVLPECVDSDGDRIIDHDDDCPDEPEDRDDFQDEDGCPDTDNDDDGFLDKDDACPDEPETFNRYIDTDGCPDVNRDTDYDGIVIPDDKCPDQPETFNGVDDNDGCPDKGPIRLNLSLGSIELLKSVSFLTKKAVLEDRAKPTLDAVAALMVSRPDIRGVEIRMFVKDDDEDFAARFANARAQILRLYLIDQGVEEGRLSAKGLAGEKTVIKFIITERTSMESDGSLTLAIRGEDLPPDDPPPSTDPPSANPPPSSDCSGDCDPPKHKKGDPPPAPSP